MGPPDAYQVGSWNSGVVKKVTSLNVQVIMPLAYASILDSPCGNGKVCTHSDAARNVSISPIFSAVGMFSLARIGHGRTSIMTSVTRLGML
jgi:hypothetical protein